MEIAALALRGARPPEPVGSSSSAAPEAPLSKSVSSTGNEATRVRRKPIPRKGHRKSRGGCFRCKQRKVKCQENTPICNNCSRLGLVCEYPKLDQNHASTALLPSAPLRSTGARFTMQDFKFFHHFVFHAYPPLPLGGNAVWEGVASISHHFDFLSHAMLGLSASHLSLMSNENYRTQALTHRVTAIQSLNQALSKPCSSTAEVDALYATLMVLAFQSSYMFDGMRDILPMLRGCVLVIGLTPPRLTSETIFQKFSWQKHEEKVQDITQELGPQSTHPQFIDDALTSVNALQPLCHTTLEIAYLGVIKNILAAAKVSLIDSLLAVPKAYALFAAPTEAEFRVFMNESNCTAQLLMIHFFILECVIGYQVLIPIMKAYPFRTAIITAWVKGVERILPSTHKKYLSWPMEFVESLYILEP